MYVNINEINRYRWPKDAVRGLFASELSHLVSYKRRSFIDRMWFVRFYPYVESVRTEVELESDNIAVERGYGKELIQERIYQFRINDKKRLQKEKRVYQSVDSIEDSINEAAG